MTYRPVFQKLLYLLFIVLSIQPVAAQDITGLWEVKEVLVEDQIMTPVSRWFRFNSDNTFEAGNGWLQNGEGTWTFNSATNEFSAAEKNWLIDKAGPFTLSWEGEEMVWERTEENMPVAVRMVRIEEKPMAPADKLKGLWDLVSVEKDGKDITGEIDPDGAFNILIRWDKIFLKHSAEGERSMGYWFMNAHRPELELIPFADYTKSEKWHVSLKDSKMMWTGNSDANRGVTRTFRRINEYPE